MKETLTHIYFWGGIYSQWYKSTFTSNTAEKKYFSTAEQFMMYSKAVLFNDIETANAILKTTDPKKQKALGRQVKGFNENIWNAHKMNIVIKGNLLKFSQNEALKTKLLSTENKILVEGSPYDKIWGVGLKFDDPKILDENNWQGKNLLGKALMEVRKILSSSEARDAFYKETGANNWEL